MISHEALVKISEERWEIPKSFRGDMRVPARLYASEKLLQDIFRDRSLEQLINIATLRGIQKYALAMPDMHEGYGFPIGGVAAFEATEGIISPGGIGYDINCGVRLLRSEKSLSEITAHLEALARAIFAVVPSGVGRGGRLEISDSDFSGVLEGGARRMVEMGYGQESDLLNLESNGALSEADASRVSDHAKSRGRDQLGTMGAGNHFVEVGVVEEIFNEGEARRLGLTKDHVTVLIHTGSRGLGHQIATDFIRVMVRAMPTYGITVPDRELACVPFSSPEGQAYFFAMAAGANFAWANRQVITWEVRKAWTDVFGASGGKLEVVYDVAHNIAKIEEYTIGSAPKRCVVHRKGATRSFPGQPVLIPGSMGTASYVLVGEERAMEESFGSCCHGAGRRMSRARAKKEIKGADVRRRLEEQGIVARSGSMRGLVEEAPEAYKDVEEVVDVIHRSGIATKVARLRPVAVIKG